MIDLMNSICPFLNRDIFCLYSDFKKLISKNKNLNFAEIKNK